MTLMQAFHIFGISPQLRIDNTVKSVEDAKRVSKEIQDECDKQFKKLVKKYHPDNGGTNEHIVQLTEAREIIREFKIQYVPPQQTINEFIITFPDYPDYFYNLSPNYPINIIRE